MRVLALLFFGCLLFVLFPQIDLWVSSLFYHHGFYLKKASLAQAIYKTTIFITAGIGIALLVLLIGELIAKKEWVSKKVLIYLLLVLLLGPGLIVNTLFKNHFGRARPSQIQRFGGTKKFTPALIITDQCQKNCSFSSGHAAAAFYFLALVPLLRGRAKLWALAGALLWGSIVSAVRILQGGHFLSDVYCSAVVVWGVSVGLYYLMFERNNR